MAAVGSSPLTPAPLSCSATWLSRAYLPATGRPSVGVRAGAGSTRRLPTAAAAAWPRGCALPCLRSERRVGTSVDRSLTPGIRWRRCRASPERAERVQYGGVRRSDGWLGRGCYGGLNAVAVVGLAECLPAKHHAGGQQCDDQGVARHGHQITATPNGGALARDGSDGLATIGRPASPGKRSTPASATGAGALGPIPPSLRSSRAQPPAGRERRLPRPMT